MFTPRLSRSIPGSPSRAPQATCSHRSITPFICGVTDGALRHPPTEWKLNWFYLPSFTEEGLQKMRAQVRGKIVFFDVHSLPQPMVIAKYFRAAKTLSSMGPAALLVRGGPDGTENRYLRLSRQSNTAAG